MTHFSWYAAVALVASLTMPSGGYARADAGASDMDIRLLCHEQVHRGWPCDDQDARLVGDVTYRMAGVDRLANAWRTSADRVMISTRKRPFDHPMS